MNIQVLRKISCSVSEKPNSKFQTIYNIYKTNRITIFLETKKKRIKQALRVSSSISPKLKIDEEKERRNEKM